MRFPASANKFQMIESPAVYIYMIITDQHLSCKHAYYYQLRSIKHMQIYIFKFKFYFFSSDLSTFALFQLALNL